MANYNFYFQYRLLLVLVFATVVLSVSAAADDSNKNLRQNKNNNNNNNNRHRHRRDEGEIGDIGEIGEADEADEPPDEPDQKSILPDLLLPEKQTRIINGYKVNELRYPYFALLKAAADQSNDGFRFRCGAVLIGPRLVVSAAHCDFFDKDKMSFQIGAYKNSNDGRTVKINSKIVHPQYNENEFTNDIVIYQLEANMDLPYYIELDRDSDGPDGPEEVVNYDNSEDNELVVVGFGDTDPDNTKNEYPNSLYKVEVTYVDNKTCDKKHGSNNEISDGMLCVGGDGYDSSFGDSGGPLIKQSSTTEADDILIGLVSWGRTINEPGVYVRISYYYKWIRKTVCDNYLYDAPYYFECQNKDSFLYGLITGLTSSPTKKQTLPPTKEPTATTSPPTIVPTKEPTSKEPTKDPTKEPTKKEPTTKDPTKEPTNRPLVFDGFNNINNGANTETTNTETNTETETTNTEIEFVSWNVPDGFKKLKECQGDCDTDDDCELDLVCYTRDGTLSSNSNNVPGCVTLQSSNSKDNDSSSISSVSSTVPDNYDVCIQQSYTISNKSP